MRGYLSEVDRLKQSVGLLKTNNKKAKEKNLKLKQTLKEKEDLIKQQAQKIKDLTAQLAEKEVERSVLATKLFKAKKPLGTKKSQGKKRGSKGFFRDIPDAESITSSVTHTTDLCPDCNGNLEVVGTVRKYTEDVTVIPSNTVIEHIYTKYYCAFCERQVVPLVFKSHRSFGSNLVSLVLYLRFTLRLTFDLIQTHLLDIYKFNLSSGGIQNILTQGATLFTEDYLAIGDQIKTAAVVHADETGFRNNGKNAWVWIFLTKLYCKIVFSDSRGRDVAKQHLGSNPNQVIVSDDYAAYQKLGPKNQTCWVHLLRVAKDESQVLYTELQDLYHLLKATLDKPVPKRDRRTIHQKLLQIQEAIYPIQSRKTQKRIQKSFTRLLVCLDYLDVLPENNTAERGLRPLVVMRKIFGKVASNLGARNLAILYSVIQTRKLHYPDQKNTYQLLVDYVNEKTLSFTA